MRLATLVLVGTLSSSAFAQTPCVNGQAGEYACNRIDLAAHLPVSAFSFPQHPTFTNNDIWGWTDPATGRDYAIVGSDSGTSFVEVTVPTAPVIVGSLPATSSSAV